MSVTVTASPEGEAPAEVATETVAEAAVEIAQIEADRDVAIATINAETTETVIEAQAEQRDDAQWLETVLTEFDGRLSSMQTEMAGGLASLDDRLNSLALLIQSQQAPPPSTQPPPLPEGTSLETTTVETVEIPEEGNSTGEPEPSSNKRRRAWL